MARISDLQITNGNNVNSYLIEPTLLGIAATTNSGLDYTTTLNSEFEYVNGVAIQVKFTVTNKANATLAINSLAAKGIWYENNYLAANTLKVNHTYTLVYDTTLNSNNGGWVLVGDIDTNTDTTYTFANGTNGFTVTPSGGSAQTVTVTPSIANNITGSGTSGSLAKFNGTNTITNGPALGTDATKFLNNKGEWAVPSYTTNTDYKVKQEGVAETAQAGVGEDLHILLKKSANTTDETDSVKYVKTTDAHVTINTKTGKVSAPVFEGTNSATNAIHFIGKATSAGSADTAAQVPWSGVQNTPTTLQGYGITDAATSTHKHGNIQNGGTLQTTDVAIGDGDKLVITDASDSNKIARASITFDGATATKALTQKGTWETFNNYSLPLAANGTRGGIQIGFSTNAANRNYAVQLSSEKAYVNVPWTDQNVTQSADTSNADIPVLLKGTTGNATTGAVKYPNTTDKLVTVNPSTGTLTAKKFSGEVALSDVSGAADLQAIEALGNTIGFLKKTGANTWTIDTTGYTTNTGTVTSVQVQASNPLQSSTSTASSTTLSTTISFKNQDANLVLAGPATGNAAAPTFRALVAADIPNLSASKITSGTFANDRIANPKVTIADNEVLLGGSLAANTLRASLGLANAMHFIGKATATITDGGTENPTISGYDFTNNKTAGDVIIDKDNNREYVWTLTGAWELLGQDASTTYDSGAAVTNKWISRIQQKSDRTITATIGTLDTSGDWTGKAAKATADADGNTISTTYVKKVTSTDEAIVRFDGTGGAIQNSKTTIDDNGAIHVGGEGIYFTGANNLVAAFKLTQSYVAKDNIDMGWEWSSVGGAGAFFHSTANTSTPGMFGFFARTKSGNSTITTELYGYPGTANNNGKLTWGGKRVVTATDDTQIGSATQPVYISNTGVATACTTIGASGYHADSYFVKAVTSTDNAIVRFDGTSGQVQNSSITIDDNGNLVIAHATNATMTTASTNPQIVFSESGGQPVHLIYTDYDSYRSPAGLKVIGGASASPAWFEVEGNVYSAKFVGPLEGNADTATTATKFSSTRTITLTGAVTGSATADGSSGWSIATTVNHEHKLLEPLSAGIGSGQTSHATALKNWFDSNKSTTPREKFITFESSVSNNGSYYMGYWIKNYDNNPYGGFFVAHYNTPYYVGISNGTYTQKTILTNSDTYATNTTGAAVSVPRNTETTIATINGVAIKIKTPASDNTWRPIGTGASDAMAGNTNVNNVSQGTTTTSNWRKILLSGQDYAAYNTAVGNDQNTVTYRAVGVSIQPSTGSMRIGGTFIAGAGMEIYGHIAGDTGTTGHGAYSGGGYHSSYNNIILHGDPTTGTSGLLFISDKGTTNINQYSDRAFIQWHAHGVTTFAAEGTAPTLATTGEANQLIIGVGNDSNDQVRIQTPDRLGLLHQVGASGYVIPDTGNTTGNVGSSTGPVYINGGVITACTTYANASVSYATSSGKATNDSDGNAINTTYLKLSGGTMTGEVSPIGRSNFIVYPSDGFFSSNGSTGYIKIKLPQVKSCTMISFDVDIYNYASGTSVRYHICGYPYSDSNWYNNTAYAIGPLSNAKANLKVRFVYDGGQDEYITIGETNTTWDYPKVIVHNILLGFSNSEYAKWASGWTVSIINTAITDAHIKSTITNTNIAYKTAAANLTTTANALAYYTDNAGTFGTKASANGALYATSTNGALNWGTLPVAQGGTGATAAAGARTNLGLGTVATYNIVGTGNKNGYSSTEILIPRILTDGVMEVGKYIDFHASAGDSKDYDVRITATTTGLAISGTTSGTFSGPLTGNVTGNVTGNADTATKFSSTRKIELTGAVTGSDTKDGSSGWSIATTITGLSRVTRYSKNSSNTKIEDVTGFETSNKSFLTLWGFAPTATYYTTGDRPAPYGIGFTDGSDSGGIMPVGDANALKEIRFYGANSGPTKFTFGHQRWDATTYDSNNTNHYETFLEIEGDNGNLTTEGKITVKQNAINNTAFYNHIMIHGHNNSETGTGETHDNSKASWGIGFQRRWNKGDTTTSCAGIYVIPSGGWRAGLLFRTKNNGTASGGAHDIDALWLSPIGNVTAGRGLGVANTDSTTGTGISLYNSATSGAPTYGLFFGGTATFGTHGAVTSDWATYFTMSDTTNRGWIFRRGSTNVCSIDGTGKIYLGYAASTANPGIYWNPYVESASDSSDASAIYQIKAGVAGGTELRISQANDSNDVINIVSPYYIYMNSKRIFTINDNWFRINENSGFSSGVYFGSGTGGVVRTDNQFQVGDSGNKFYANSSGNGYFSNTLGVGGTNTNYKLYVNGTTGSTEYVVNAKVRLEWNATDLSLDFVFV